MSHSISDQSRRPRRARHLWPIIIPVIVLSLLGLALRGVGAQVSPPTLALEKSTFVADVASGTPFEYILSYACASVDQNCEQPNIADALPPEVEFVGLVSTPDVESAAYDALNHVVNFDFGDELTAGSTGILRILVQFPPGTPPGTVASNDATFTADNATTVTTAEVDVTATGAFEMFADKTVGEVVVGFPTDFTLAVCSPDTVGGVNLSAPVVFVDQLPPEATFVGAPGSDWTYDEIANTVTFTITDDIPVGGCEERTLTVLYDEIPPVQQTNVLTVTGTPEGCPEEPHCGGEGERTLVDTVDFGVIGPYSEAETDKSSSAPSSYNGTEALPGEQVVYTLSAENSGYLTLTNATMTDTIPAEIDLQSFSTGSPPDVAGVNVFYYTDQLGGPIAAPGNPYLSDTTIDVSTLGLTAGDFVTQLVWQLGEMEVGEAWSSTATGIVDPTIVPTNGANPGPSFTNTGTFSADAPDAPIVQVNTSTVGVIDERAIPRPRKSADPGPYLPGDFVVFTSRVTNDAVAHLNFENPVMVDLLPPQFEYVPGSYQFLSGDSYTPTAPFFEYITGTIDSGTGTFTTTIGVGDETLELLRWSWTDANGTAISLPPGEEMVVEFTVRVKDDVPPGRYYNKNIITGNDNLPEDVLLCTGDELYTDALDLDGDGLTAEQGCRNSDAEGYGDVGIFLAMASEKLVRGALDADFNKNGLTYTGGEADYKLVITNTSNVSVTNLAIIDILPFKDDTGVIDPSARQTDWRPNLQGPIVFSDSLPITVFYSTESNPCRPELVPSGPAGCTEPNWTSTVPDDITSVQSLKFDFCSYDEITGDVIECLVIERNETFEFTWPMIAPNDAPESSDCTADPIGPACEIAWNSFGFTAQQFTPDGNGLQLRPAEPVKVGIRVTPDEPNVSIGNFVWLDNAGDHQDGIQQPEELGVNGVRVELYDDTGNYLGYRITGPDDNGNSGYYEFGGLDPDTDYVVRFIPPPQYGVSPGEQGGDTALDSNWNSTGTETGGGDGYFADEPYNGVYYEGDPVSTGATGNTTVDFAVWLPMDYGDAPGDYPTNSDDLTSGGGNPADAARHVIRDDIGNGLAIYLGSGVDAEVDGQPNDTATGDDNDGNDDEDGVVFGESITDDGEPVAVMVPGETTDISVTAVFTATGLNAPTEAYLVGWIDWDGDGIWQADEEVVFPNPIAASNDPITIDLTNLAVPADAVPGQTYARFRFSTTPDLGTTGIAFDGEVEDYVIQIVTPPAKGITATSEAHTGEDGSGDDAGDARELTIGEIIEYSLTVSVPEGTMTNFQISDSLPDGLLYIAGSVEVTTIQDTTITYTNDPVGVTPGSFASGTDPVFSFGTLTNNDSDGGEEFITVTFDALVVNESANQDGTSLENSFTVDYDGVDPRTSNAVFAAVVEPEMTIDKSVTPQTGDAGDIINYTVAIAHGDDSHATAFDLVIDDLIPAGLTLDLGSVTIVATGVVTNAVDNSSGNQLLINIDGMEIGATVEVTFQATILPSVSPGETITNVADLTFTSLPDGGTLSNPTGSDTPGASGDEDGERGGSDGPGGPNDYSVSDNAPIDILSPVPTKTISGTSDPNTADDSADTQADPRELTIGEVISFTFTVQIPEVTASGLNFELQDNLPDGLQLLPGSVTIDIDSTTPMTVEPDLTGANSGPIPLPAGRIDTSGGVLAFDLGAVANNDSDPDGEFIIIEFATVVTNDVALENGVELENSFSVLINDEVQATSDPVYMQIVEPQITTTKSVLPVSGVEAGDSLNYTVRFANSGDSVAYDVTAEDTLAQGVAFAALVGCVDQDALTVAATATDNGTTVLFDGDPAGSWDIAVGDYIECTYTATALSTLHIDGDHTNVIDADWSSQDGDTNPDERIYDDTTPYTVDGDQDSDDAVFSVPAPTFDKSDGGTVVRTIGEVVPYTLTINAPLGTLRDLVISDVLPQGLIFNEDYVVSAGVTAPLTVTISTPNDGSAPVTLTWEFEDALVSANSFTITFTATVANVIENQDGVNRNNTATMAWTDAQDAPQSLNDSDDFDIVEPVVAIDKALVDLPFPLSVGSTITYQVVLAHDPASTADAFDLVVTDTLPTVFDPSTLTVTGISASGTAAPTSEVDTVNGVLRVPNSADSNSFDLPQGAVVTITFTAELGAGYVPGPTISNNAGVVWTSTDGPNDNERDGGGAEPDGQDLYGDPPVALDDYENAASVSFNAADYGDLPESGTSYATSEANGGAVHFVDGVTFLGSGVDGEADGVPSGNADGDDLADSDDEDGITFLTPIMPGQVFSVSVTAGGDGYLNAWIDFDGNGQLDAGEQLFTDEFLTGGSTTVLTYTAPLDVDPELFSRFRFTSYDTGGTLGPDGQASDGEVEDYALLSLGDTIWRDDGGTTGTANDGVLNGDEAPVQGVVVELRDGAGNPVLNGSGLPVTTTTDVNGNYLFTGLEPGDYTVHVAAANFDTAGPLYGLLSSAGAGDADADSNQDVDENGLDDLNPVANGISSGVVTLALGDEPGGAFGHANDALDFGFVEVDWGDLPEAGTSYNTTMSGGGAAHLLDGTTFLGAGVDADANGQPDVNAQGDDNADSADEDGITFLTPIVPGTVAEVQVVAGADGFLNAWIDFNGDGVMDPGEQIATDEPLAAGTHTITVTVPLDATITDTIYSRFRFTSYDTGGTLGPDGLALDGEVEDYALMNLGDTVWLDINQDGVQDGGLEVGIPGVVVNLLDENGLPIVDANNNPITATTDASGNYNFGGLPEDTYIVEIAASNWDAGNVFGTGGAYEGAVGSPGQGADDGDNSDDNGNNDGTAAIGVGVQSTPITLELGTEPGASGSANADLSVDFGFYQPLSLGDAIWFDADGDGQQDGDEDGIADMVVELFLVDPVTGDLIPAVDIDGNTVISQTTGSDGLYNFTNLPQGDYVVQVTPPVDSDYALTIGGADPDADPSNTDSNGYNNGGVIQSQPVTLSAYAEPTDDGDTNSNSNLSVDFGFVEPVSLGNRIWEDTNGDGVQDALEPSLEGATVTLYRVDPITGNLIPAVDVDGTAVLSQTTTSTGLYNFTNLPPGDYVVEVDPPANYVLTTGATVLDPDDNPSNADSNGYDNNGAIQSLPITLISRAEPELEDDEELIADNNSNLTVDFGFYEPVSVGDFVWYDTDSNGLQDDGAPPVGVENVTVILLDGTTLLPILDGNGDPITTTTDSDGAYLFDGLPPGNYAVQFDLTTLPAGYAPTTQDVDGNVSDAADSDADQYTGISAPTGFLNSGQSDTTLDMGLAESVTVGDRVWLDNNSDGLQDDPADEPGIAGVTALLYDTATGQPVLDANGDPITDVTDANGEYLFEELPVGDYYVVFDLTTLPNPNYVVTGQDANGNMSDSIDSDADPITGATAPTGFLTGGADDLTLDMGLYLPASLGDFVWEDLNGDGIQDPGELGIEGVVVNLLDENGDPVLVGGLPVTTTTSATGAYTFTNLPPGNYIVEFEPPAGYEFSPADNNTGPDGDAGDSDANVITGRSGVITLDSGENDPTIDAGLYQPVSVGDTVWYDNDYDGLQGDPVLEPGVEGVVVTLLDGDTGQPILDGGGLPITATTDAAGMYLFDGLPPGNYQIAFDLTTLPAGYRPITPDQGDDALDSDANQLTGRTPATGFLASGSDDLTLDMGIYEFASIGDFAWYDLNEDGVQDIDEPGLPGVQVQLFLDGSATPVLTTTTSATGYYSFTDLIPDDYYLVFTPPPAFLISPQDVGTTTDALDSDIDGAGTTIVTTLDPGENDPDWDAGFYPIPAAIGDFVWEDLNADGVQDPGEPGIAGITVTLTFTPSLGGAPIVSTTVTSEFGTYLFSDLPPGTGTVQFTLPPGSGYLVSPQDVTITTDGLDSDADPTTLTTIEIDLAAGEVDPTWDLGLYRLASLGDFVWDDLNGDGIQDAGEPGIEGVVVNLLDGNGNPVLVGGVPLTTTTDAFGAYAFVDLPPGDYIVEFEPPAGYVPSPDNIDTGPDGDAGDSDMDPITFRSGTVTLQSGDDNVTLDAGLYQPVEIGDRVWYDNNGDGIQDAVLDEPGVPDVTVTLIDADTGQPVLVGGLPVTTTTDSSGEYLFSDLPPGNYAVRFDLTTLPNGYSVTAQDAGGDNSADSDADPITGETVSNGYLASGAQDLTHDLGIYQPNSLGDRVWYDNNADGLQDDPVDEPGVPNVVVTLYDNATGLPYEIAPGVPYTATTDGAGDYLFTNLPPGEFYVVFDLSTIPTGAIVTEVNANGNLSDTLDSDADPLTGATTPTVLADGTSDLTHDMGLYLPVSVGDRVWYDNDWDGQQGDVGTEPGVSDVTVTLYDAATGLPYEVTPGVPYTDTTDGNGDYLFDGLPPGEYYVVFDLDTLPGTYVPTQQNQGDNATDSDADPFTGQTGTTGVLAGGESNLTLDMGISLPVSVGDRVWLDNDADGIQDDPTDEPGVENVVVTLYDATTNQPFEIAPGVPYTNTTNGDGNYLFENLPPGNYYVVFDLTTLPANYTVTMQNMGASDVDSDADPETGQTGATGFLNGGQSVDTLDMGIVPQGPTQIRLLAVGVEQAQPALWIVAAFALLLLYGVALAITVRREVVRNKIDENR